VGKRTVPTKNLDQDGKEKAGKMKNPDDLVFNTPYRSQKQKDNPEKMDKDNDIGKDLTKHLELGL